MKKRIEKEKHTTMGEGEREREEWGRRELHIIYCYLSTLLSRASLLRATILESNF